MTLLAATTAKDVAETLTLNTTAARTATKTLSSGIHHATDFADATSDSFARCKFCLTHVKPFQDGLLDCIS
jgi:heterodisulfide reductase subunit A-like polyferredoxin